MITVIETPVRREEKVVLQTDVFVTVIDDNSNQEATVVAAIMKKVFKAFKKNNEGVHSAWLRSDQAACYKSSKLIHPLWCIRKKYVNLLGYIFSEAGSGKSRCDQVC